jgi:hypothetical protein
VTFCDENVTSHLFVTVPHSNPGPGSGKNLARNDPGDNAVITREKTIAKAAKIPDNNRFRVPIQFATNRFAFEKFAPPLFPPWTFLLDRNFSTRAIFNFSQSWGLKQICPRQGPALVF